MNSQPCSLLSDEAGLLRFRERKQIKRMLEKFAWRFPGRFLAVMTVSQASAQQCALVALAALNRSRFTEIAGLNSDAGLLLLIDIEKRQATMVHGYLWESHWSEADAAFCLEKAQHHWRNGAYLSGLIAVIGSVEKTLVRRHRRLSQVAHAWWHPRAWMARIAQARKGEGGRI